MNRTVLPKSLFILEKRVGQTPLEAILEFRSKNSQYKKIKMAYAGRLDPMTEGLLLVLTGDECRKREKYQNLDKRYEAEVLFGVRTDSYDCLGILVSSQERPVKQNDAISTLKSFSGRIIQKYPPYSSKAVSGKPLYWWAREGKLSQIRIPEKEISIYDIQLLSFDKITSSDLQKLIYFKINLVKGDFRQKQILSSWSSFFQNDHRKVFQVAKILISCSSGTYIRTLANDWGRLLKVRAIALSIKRTAVGKYNL